MGSLEDSLWTALRMRRLEELTALLEQNRWLVHSVTSDGGTPLHGAALFGDAEAASILLANGALVDAKDKDGNTPLIVAVKQLHIPVLKVLLDNGADINAENIHGATPMRALMARMNGRDLLSRFSSPAGAERAAEQITEILNRHVEASFVRAAETATVKKVVFVELPEPESHWFFVRFLEHRSQNKSEIDPTLKGENVKIIGVADHDDLAIMMPQSAEAVRSCRSYLKEIAAEALCPPGGDLGLVAGLLLQIE
jgi:ankyrin repeat protein